MPPVKNVVDPNSLRLVVQTTCQTGPEDWAIESRVLDIPPDARREIAAWLTETGGRGPKLAFEYFPEGAAVLPLPVARVTPTEAERWTPEWLTTTLNQWLDAARGWVGGRDPATFEESYQEIEDVRDVLTRLLGYTSLADVVGGLGLVQRALHEVRLERAAAKRTKAGR